MKFNKKLLPYYLSRALIAALLGWLIGASSGLVIMGIIIGLLTFAGFLYYLHSGRFIVDEKHPLTPLRRDERAESIRNKALVAAVVVGALAYITIIFLNRTISFEIPTSLALVAGVAAYFVYSIVMDKKS